MRRLRIAGERGVLAGGWSPLLAANADPAPGLRLRVELVGEGVVFGAAERGVPAFPPPPRGSPSAP